MKKIMPVCLALVLALTACCAAAEAGKPASRMYYADQTGISFPYMDGWERMDQTLARGVYFGFMQPGNAGATVLYIRTDLWRNLIEMTPDLTIPRERMNDEFLREESVAVLVSPSSIQNLRTATYGEIIYRLYDGESHAEDDPGKAKYTTVAVTMNYGIVHGFRITAGTEAGRDALMPEFEAFLSEVRLTKPDFTTPFTGSQLDVRGDLPGGTSLSGPGEIDVKILVRNTGDEGFPGPAELYDPDLNRVEEFGSPVLRAGESLTWEGRWTLTQEQLEEGQIAFYVRYAAKDETTGEQITKAKKIVMKFTYSR